MRSIGLASPTGIGDRKAVAVPWQIGMLGDEIGFSFDGLERQNLPRDALCRAVPSTAGCGTVCCRHLDGVTHTRRFHDPIQARSDDSFAFSHGRYLRTRRLVKMGRHRSKSWGKARL